MYSEDFAFQCTPGFQAAVFRNRERGAAVSEKDLAELQARQFLEGPRVGEDWRHYQGKVYRVLARSVDEGTWELLVTYCSVEDGTYWTRTLDNWSEEVNGVPRFTKLEAS